MRKGPWLNNISTHLRNIKVKIKKPGRLLFNLAGGCVVVHFFAAFLVAATFVFLLMHRLSSNGDKPAATLTTFPFTFKYTTHTS